MFDNFCGIDYKVFQQNLSLLQSFTFIINIHQFFFSNCPCVFFIVLKGTYRKSHANLETLGCSMASFPGAMTWDRMQRISLIHNGSSALDLYGFVMFAYPMTFTSFTHPTIHGGVLCKVYVAFSKVGSFDLSLTWSHEDAWPVQRHRSKRQILLSCNHAFHSAG